MTAFRRFLGFGLLSVILFSVVTAVAATNTIPSTRLGNLTIPVRLNGLKPSACAGINVTNLIIGVGTITGTSGNDLILASPSIDVVDGLDGNDCILSGGGADLITGNIGNDVCMGGPETDVFTTCEVEIQ